jgi:nucleotide-binding universal stress UspA family protein
MIVAMAVVTTMAMPPMLRWALARVPLRKAEKERLEREEFEARGFVANLERLLVIADESPNGRFASRLAGLLAGARGLPVTILPPSATGRSKSKQESKPRNGKTAERVEEAVKAAAKDTTSTSDSEPAAVDITIREHDKPTEEAVAKEATKGYDLLVLGVANTRARNGEFHQDITPIAAAFHGPLALVAAHGVHLREPERSPLRILVPANGTDVSRRAAEVAIAIARASGSAITVLYVATTGVSNGRNRKRRGFRASRREQAIVKEIVEIANRYDVTTATVMRADVAPDDAILFEAKTRAHNLIIMGVGRRPGDKLFFGDTAATVFEKSPASIVFVAS